MKKYIIIQHQEGGCDYTIGCGIDIKIVEAPSIESAILDFMYKGDELITLNVDYSPDSFEIYEIGEHLSEDECMSLYEEEKLKVDQEEAENTLKEQELWELKEYNRLKAKFSNKY